ncbi:MAG: nucleotide sugar dehydrogenase [Candidatus Omnitrophota bacterium]
MDSVFVGLKEKISRKKALVAVVGLGYVGLPLAAAFAKAGFSVIGVEADKDRLKRLRKKISYIADVPATVLRKIISSRALSLEENFDRLKTADVVIICVPTPLKHKYSPDISFIMAAVKQIKKLLHRGQLVVLESTTYPGTTEEEILPVLESEGLICGRDFYLAFSPERIDPGNARYPIQNIPKVVGGISPEATELACLLYKNIVRRTVPVSSARVAETVKLLENTFRIVNIGLIDEIAMMCHKMKIDIWEVIEAAKTKPFGFMPFYPGPGVGGHCIGKDPLYLYWKAKKFGFHSRFIKLASDITSSMPQYVIERLSAILNNASVSFKQAKVLVIGVTYKKDVLDLRKSPALEIIEILQNKGVLVSYHDPLIPYLKFERINLKSVSLSKARLADFDCAIIATGHSCLDYGFILKNSRFIFDTRNVYKGLEDKRICRL